MSIPVTCSYCRASFQVAEQLEGQHARCPSCRNRTEVPTRVYVVDEDEALDDASCLDDEPEVDSSLFQA